MIFENNNFRNENKTVLTEDEKALLLEKIKELETTRYDEIMNQYSTQTAKIDELIANIYDKKAGLDKIRKDISVLNTTIKLDEIIGPPSQNGEGVQGEQQTESGSTENNTGENTQNNVQSNSENSSQTGTEQNPQKQMQEILNKIQDKK